MLDRYERITARQSRTYYVPPDRPAAELTADALREGLSALADTFDLGTTLPPVRAILAPDRNAFDALVADMLDVEIERPSDPRRIAQPQRTDIVFLSPSAYAAESAYDYVPDDYRRMVHHELVHVVQEHLSPNIEVSPLWWDEGLAVYLSDQWQHASPFRFREPVQLALERGELPALSDVLSDPSLAYPFGWTVVRFLEQAKGSECIVRAVKEVADGDVLAALGETASHLEPRWRTWLLRRGVG